MVGGKLHFPYPEARTAEEAQEYLRASVASSSRDMPPPATPKKKKKRAKARGLRKKSVLKECLDDVIKDILFLRVEWRAGAGFARSLTQAPPSESCDSKVSLSEAEGPDPVAALRGKPVDLDSDLDEGHGEELPVPKTKKMRVGGKKMKKRTKTNKEPATEKSDKEPATEKSDKGDVAEKKDKPEETATPQAAESAAEAAPAEAAAPVAVGNGAAPAAGETAPGAPAPDVTAVATKSPEQDEVPAAKETKPEEATPEAETPAEPAAREADTPTGGADGGTGGNERPPTS